MGHVVFCPGGKAKFELAGGAIERGTTPGRI